MGVTNLEIINGLNNAIEYIENNLDSTIEIDEIAKVAFTSRYHFQRMFHVLTGFTLGEYVRNRRLTLAAEELTSKDAKVTDIAMKQLRWAVFDGKGNNLNRFEISNLWRRIYLEWFPTSGFEQVEGPCMEKYFWDDNQYDNYSCEVWIPVKRKKGI